MKKIAAYIRERTNQVSAYAKIHHYADAMHWEIEMVYLSQEKNTELQTDWIIKDFQKKRFELLLLPGIRYPGGNYYDSVHQLARLNRAKLPLRFIREDFSEKEFALFFEIIQPHLHCTSKLEL